MPRHISADARSGLVATGGSRLCYLREKHVELLVSLLERVGR